MEQHDLRCARAGLTQVIEPAEAIGNVATKTWGPIRLLEIIQGSTPTQQEWAKLTEPCIDDAAFASSLRNNLGSAISRWRRRSDYLQPDKALDYITKLGGHFLIPEDFQWPVALADLAMTEPLGLWIIGDSSLPSMEHMVSLVGSRESTSYGLTATEMLATAARSFGVTVVSGGAYGIDAHAHRKALDAAGNGLPTIAVLAGGLDRLYPAGNVELLHEIAASCVLVSEMPPGMRPNRYRFLNRNRVIAALSAATIVVEARFRSGALSTANHAHDIGRIVGAVPGRIDVPSSSGCHRLLKETPALLIDDPVDLEAIFKPLGTANSASSDRAESRPYDFLDVEEMLVFEALPIKTRINIERLCGITGIAVPRITGILTKLARHNLANHSDTGWRKSKNIRG